jgi:hypothetical protein
MRSLCAALAIILLHSLPPVRAQQSDRPVPDAVVRLLAIWKTCWPRER